jgi:hypothetical protein
MCGAPILVRKTDNVATPSKVALGPGVMATIPIADDIQSIQQNADLPGIQASRQALVGLVALTNRQPPDGYETERKGDTPSGIALKIKNAPYEKARREAKARAISVEKELMAVMVEVHDIWRGTSIADEGIAYEMVPTDPPELEDPTERQRRLIEQRDAGLISDEELMVQLGQARTIEEARAKLKKIREQKKGERSQLRDALDAAVNRPIPGEPDDVQIRGSGAGPRDPRIDQEGPQKPGPMED